MHKRLETTQLSYLAGFFDGEGSIGIYQRKNKGFHLRNQLVQNESKCVMSIFSILIDVYGGNLSSPTKTSSGNYKRNWQLNSDKAVKFLEDILPYLIIKKDQAEISIAWQKQRPEVERNEKGQICSKKKETLDFDLKVCELVKDLKKEDIDQVMENQKDLVEVVAELKQIMCIKG